MWWFDSALLRVYNVTYCIKRTAATSVNRVRTHEPTYSQSRLVRACSLVVSISVVCKRPCAAVCVHRQRARALSGTYRDDRFVSNSKWQLEVIAEWLIKPVGSWEHPQLQRHYCFVLIHCITTNGGCKNWKPQAFGDLSVPAVELILHHLHESPITGNYSSQR
jgi:hypothetical protein